MFLKKKKNKEESVVLNVKKTNIIDAAGMDKDGTTLVLQLVDGMDWQDEAGHLLLLQEKINNYILYIESGQYLESYSNVNAVKIQIKFLFREPSNCRIFLEQAAKAIDTSPENIKIEVEYGTKDAF